MRYQRPQGPLTLDLLGPQALGVEEDRVEVLPLQVDALHFGALSPFGSHNALGLKGGGAALGASPALLG